jgi:hypothetical protein
VQVRRRCSFSTGLTMLMFHADTLMRRVNEIINHAVETGIYNNWISLRNNNFKFYSKNIPLLHPLGGYYCFHLFQIQPVFYLVVMGWCLSVLCFFVEVLFNRVLNKSFWYWKRLGFCVIFYFDGNYTGLRYPQLASCQLL